MTYVLLNVIFLAILVAALLATRHLQRQRLRPVMITLGILLALTAVFDTIIIHLGLVTYDVSKIAGVFIGRAPIEDFAYTLAVVLLIPVLWSINKASKDE